MNFSFWMRVSILQEVDLSVVEYIGFAAGYKIMERLTREWPRFKDELDTMKFICTDFWTCIYKKQIDNLRTNHQGVYVLQDNAFRFLTNFSNGHQYLEFAPRVKWTPFTSLDSLSDLLSGFQLYRLFTNSRMLITYNLYYLYDYLLYLWFVNYWIC